MKLAWSLGITCAVLLHAGVLLFGGLLFPKADAAGTTREVDLLSDVDASKDKPKDPEPDEREKLERDDEPPPDTAEMIREPEPTPLDSAPALEAASLSSMLAALDGGGGSGDFASSLSLASGGRIGGTGRAGGLDEKLEGAFSLAEIDQKPRPVFQAGPLYPAEMRGKKVDGLVSVIFVVDTAGKVSGPRVEKSNHAAFEQPAVDAVKQWRFEPAVKGGKRVACKTRVQIRFPQS